MGWRNADKSFTPDWFWKAIDTESTEAQVTVADCAVHYRCWGDPNKPGILLAHGMFAHSRWWDFIAPLLMDDYYLVALDFTGMGDSDYRYDYTAALFADEIIAVMEASGMSGGTVVAHSFGGYISIKTAVRHPHKIARLILVDVAVRALEEQAKGKEKTIMGSGDTLFADAETARRRFRLQPPQPCKNDYILDYIARRSIMRVDAGWTWKFDEDLRPSLAAGGGRNNSIDDFKAIDCPLGLIRGSESSLYEKHTVDYMQSLRRQALPVTVLEGAHHHLLVDKPLEFVAALRAMLKELG